MFVRIVMLIFFYLSASYGSIILTDQSQCVSDFSISYLNDEKSYLSVEKAAEIPFVQTVPSQFSLGYKEGTVWFKFTIVNHSSNSDFILYFSEPFWSTFHLYETGANGWIEHKNGLLTPISERQIEDANPVFPLMIAPGTSKTYLIKARTINAQIGAFKLYTLKEYFKPSRLTLRTFYPFYSGILFIILILNIFLLVEMRERIYAYYIGYVAAFIAFVGMFNGCYLYARFFPWEQGLHVVGTVVLAFMALFSKTFLELEKYYPRINTLFKFFAASFLGFGILIHLEVPLATLLFNITSTVFVTILLILAVRIWWLGKIQATYYLIALMIYMPTMGMMVLTFNGFLENTDFTRYAFLFGALIEIIFFSLILAKRFHAAKDETIKLQKELLAEKENHETYLKHKIDQQRQEIQEKNAILFHQSRHAAMGEMISMIAHQWRQPLNTLAIIIQNLYFQYKLGQWDNKHFEQSHDQFNEHLQYMSKTIDDFRNYYKNDETKHPENIGEIVELSLRLCDVFLKYAKIKTELTISTDKKGYLSKNELIQVLINLIKNGHDAITERGILAGKITINVDETDGFVVIRVCDNAGGISSSIADKIFEPYFSTKSENGTGLGLYMSKSIIEDHFGGKLTFQNVDEGTCFTIYVPLYNEAVNPADSESAL